MIQEKNIMQTKYNKKYIFLLILHLENFKVLGPIYKDVRE